MKRMALSFVFFIMLNSLTIPAMAVDNVSNQTIFYDDGSYAVVTLTGHDARSNMNKKKTYTYYDDLSRRCFAYTLIADFTYNGSASSADSCNFGVLIYRQGWELDTHSEYVSGNTAYGSAVFTGPDGQVCPVSLTLTCDKNGNVT